MTIEEFEKTLDGTRPPQGISENLGALWYEARGDWDKAHTIVQQTGGFEGDWIHAYLHRKEGDRSNASYWYSKAGKSLPDMTLKEEWKQLATYLLGQ